MIRSYPACNLDRDPPPQFLIGAPGRLSSLFLASFAFSARVNYFGLPF